MNNRWGGLWVGLALAFAPGLVHAQVLRAGPVADDPLAAPPPNGDSIISLVADSANLPELDPAAIPRSGTFWLISQNGLAEPWPTVPPGGTAQIFQIAPGQFLVAEPGGPLARPRWRPGWAVPVTGDYVAAALGIQAAAAENIINQVQTVAVNQAMGAADDDHGGPMPPGGFGGGGAYTNNYIAVPRRFQWRVGDLSRSDFVTVAVRLQPTERKRPPAYASRSDA